MKDFNTVQQYLWEEDEYSGFGGGFLYTHTEGQFVSYEDYKLLLEDYKEIKFILEGLEK